MKTVKTTFIVQGTHCHSCKALIEEVALEIPGVKSCHVDFRTGKTVVEHDSEKALLTVKKEIETLGEYRIVSEKRE